MAELPPPDDALPGLGQVAGRPVSDLERAVRRTIAALDELDMLTDVDAVRLQLMLEIAETSHDMKMRRRTSTIEKGWRLLWEIVDSFTAEEGEVDDKLKAAMEQWAEEVGPRPAPEGASP